LLVLGLVLFVAQLNCYVSALSCELLALGGKFLVLASECINHDSTAFLLSLESGHLAVDTLVFILLG